MTQTQSATKYKYDVFISYSRKDTKIANRICEAFDQANITYFIDRQGITGGMEFPAVLAQAIRESKVFLFLASKNSYKSKFTQSEIIYAFNKKEKQDIIPYIIDGSELPEELAFTFSAINWREIDQHPIETVLLKDVQQRIGRETQTETIDKRFIFTGKLLAKIILSFSITFFVFISISELADAPYLNGQNSFTSIASTVSLLAVTVLLLVGFIRPKSVELTDRKEVAKFYLPAFIILFFALGISASSDRRKYDNELTETTITIEGVVDLGLPSRTLWASCNLGAIDSSDYGDYFAWGDIVTSRSQPKPTHDSLLNIIGTTYDAAFMLLGKQWHLPTDTQFQELISCCRWEWTKQKEHNGCLVTGPNGNSIFLPASGCIIKNGVKYQEEFGYYWTGTSLKQYPNLALELLFGAESQNIESGRKNVPRTIRPVYQKDE